MWDLCAMADTHLCDLCDMAYTHMCDVCHVHAPQQRVDHTLAYHKPLVLGPERKKQHINIEIYSDNNNKKQPTSRPPPLHVDEWGHAGPQHPRAPATAGPPQRLAEGAGPGSVVSDKTSIIMINNNKKNRRLVTLIMIMIICLSFIINLGNCLDLNCLRPSTL